MSEEIRDVLRLLPSLPGYEPETGLSGADGSGSEVSERPPYEQPRMPALKAVWGEGAPVQIRAPSPQHQNDGSEDGCDTEYTSSTAPVIAPLLLTQCSFVC